MAAAASNEAQVSFRDEWVDRISIRGRSEEYPMIDDAPLFLGRHISRLEDQKSANVVVLGWEVYTRLFPGGDPLGARIKIGRKHFTVTGVVEDLGTVLGESKNRSLKSMAH